MAISFKDLDNFVTTATSKTLSEAAEKLSMAQPSLSLGIQKLEKNLGQTLFIRSREGVKLTPQGKQIFPDAVEALKLMEKLKGNKTNLKFRIGLHPSVGMFILGDFLKELHQKKPDINFEIVNASSHDINKMVAQGDVDFGVVMNPLQLQGLIIKEIGEDLVQVWESKDRYQNNIIYHPQMLQATSILSRWKEAPQTSTFVENLELVAHLAASGAGMAILPTQVVKAQKLNLKKVPHTPTYKDHLALVCYPEMIRSNEGKLIFDGLKRSFRK